MIGGGVRAACDATLPGTRSLFSAPAAAGARDSRRVRRGPAARSLRRASEGARAAAVTGHRAMDRAKRRLWEMCLVIGDALVGRPRSSQSGRNSEFLEQLDPGATRPSLRP